MKLWDEIQEKRKLMFHKKYRREKKWRDMNPHNFTTLKNWSSHPYVHVGKMTYGEINAFCYRENCGHIYIGNYCSIAKEVTFHLAENHATERLSTYPFETFCFQEEAATISKGDIVIGDDVWIGYHATILSGVKIGQGAVIAAGAVVTKDVLPYAIVAGIPAKVVKYRFPPEMIKELLQVDYSKIDEAYILEHRDLFLVPLAEQKKSISSIVSELGN